MGITVAQGKLKTILLKNWFFGGGGGGVGRGQAMSILGDVQLTNTILANIVYGINMGCRINAFYMRIFPSSNSQRKSCLIVWDWKIF